MCVYQVSFSPYTTVEMNILRARAPCFSLVSGFSCVTTRGLTGELGEQSLVAHEKPFSAKQSEYMSLLAFLRQPPKT